MILPAICPKCDELILVDKKEAFSQCALCEKTISAHEGIQSLQDYCSIPGNTNEVIERCIKLDEKYGPEVPLSILSIVAQNFPMNEQVAFLMVRMDGYEPLMVRDYLSRFKTSKKKAPFAEEFLDKAMTVRNMEFAGMFEIYIQRLMEHKRQRYIELMRTLMESYTKVSTSTRALTWLYGFYIGGGLINVAMVLWFIFDSMPLWLHALIAAAVLGVQISFLFLHNRRYGNRVKITDRERLLMTIYMSSIAVAIGGVFIGWLIRF